jgi:hypothetical protein
MRSPFLIANFSTEIAVVATRLQFATYPERPDSDIGFVMQPKLEEFGKMVFCARQVSGKGLKLWARSANRCVN